MFSSILTSNLECDQITNGIYSVLATSDTMPGFWIFMYRVSPFTYLVSGVLSTGLSGAQATCSDIEISRIVPPAGETCIEYLSDYLKQFPSRLLNENSTTMCEICSIRDTDTFLAQVNIYHSDVWRNVGILFAFIVFNIFAAVGLYWLVRVPKKSFKKSKKE